MCSAALSLRKARQLRVRLPLASLTVAHPSAPALTEFADIIKDEVNVKDLVLSADPASLGAVPAHGQPARRSARASASRCRRSSARSRPATGPQATATSSRPAACELQPGEYELTLTAADPDSTAALPGSDGLIALDTAVTPELAAEGTARDVIRVIQQARRDAGLDVSDRIALVVGADDPVASAVRAHADFIARGNAGHRPDRRPRGRGRLAARSRSATAPKSGSASTGKAKTRSVRYELADSALQTQRRGATGGAGQRPRAPAGRDRSLAPPMSAFCPSR